MKGNFVGRLEVQYIDGILWRVSQSPPPETFGFSLDDGRFISPPEGLITDFASIPKPLWEVFPPTGDGPKARYGLSAVIHDYLYQTGQIDGVPIARRYADAIFYAANLSLGIPRWLALTLDWGLLVGGGPAWDNYRRLQIKTTTRRMQNAT